MRIDLGQTLDGHEAEHFRQALLAVKHARGCTGADIDRLCFFPIGTTSALLRNDRVIHRRYVARYCKDLDIDPDKPWGIATCQYCSSVATVNGVPPDITSLDCSVGQPLQTMTTSERLKHIIHECTILLHQSGQVESSAPSALANLTFSWRRMNREVRRRFLHEMLTDEERAELARDLLVLETPEP